MSKQKTEPTWSSLSQCCRVHLCVPPYHFFSWRNKVISIFFFRFSFVVGTADFYCWINPGSKSQEYSASYFNYFDFKMGDRPHWCYRLLFLLVLQGRPFWILEWNGGFFSYVKHTNLGIKDVVLWLVSNWLLGFNEFKW